MKQILLLVMAVAVGLTSVGCSKENPPRPAADSTALDDAGQAKWEAAYEHAMEEWWGNLVGCLHCSSDLVKKGAKVCAECGKDQKPLIANPIVEQAIRDELFGPTEPKNEGEPDEPVINVAYELTKADLAKLTDLSLSGTGITDAGLKEVAKLQQLKRLSLINTKITDAGLKEIAKMQKLTTLFLDDTNITDAGVAEFKKALPKCAIVR